ncbi:MAG: cytochrome-c peroxidase [Phycisphaerales bacterium]
MIRRLHALVALMLVCGSAAGAADDPRDEQKPGSTIEAPVEFTPGERAAILTLSPLPPPPPDPTNRVADDPRAARLGQAIFFDPRFSADGTVSCASCHDPAKGWGDGRALPPPERFGADLRHVPTLWNVAYNRWFFWDGRADSLWSQALVPLEHPREHAGSRAQFQQLVRDDAPLRRAYQHVFGSLSPAAPEPAAADIDMTFANLGKALAAYQRRIVSRRAPFDVFVEGLREGDAKKSAAISPAAQRGLRLFVGRADCRSCHGGPNFSDAEFHDTGVAEAFDRVDRHDPGRFGGINALLSNPFNALGPMSDDPEGRTRHRTSFLVNSVEWRGHFKTPTLRNVATTAPYMHRGQIATLEGVIRFYSTLGAPPDDAELRASIAEKVRQRPVSPIRSSRPHAHGGAESEQVLRRLDLSPAEIADLIEFLKSLTDTSLDPALMTPLELAE